jgi:hypothetical protein
MQTMNWLIIMRRLYLLMIQFYCRVRAKLISHASQLALMDEKD